MDAAPLIGRQVVAPAVERLVGEASQGLIIISAYFKPWDDLSDMLEAAAARIPVILVVRRKDREARRFADSVELLAHGDVHAKLYVSDRAAIVSSMNLHGYSADNNIESGLWLNASTAAGLHGELRVHAERIVEEARLAGLGTRRRRRTGSGHCIRCGDGIPLNPMRPLCFCCFDLLVDFEDEDYVAKRCHRCGGRERTTFARPLCDACFDAASRRRRPRRRRDR